MSSTVIMSILVVVLGGSVAAYVWPRAEVRLEKLFVATFGALVGSLIGRVLSDPRLDGAPLLRCCRSFRILGAGLGEPKTPFRSLAASRRCIAMCLRRTRALRLSRKLCAATAPRRWLRPSNTPAKPPTATGTRSALVERHGGIPHAKHHAQ